MNCQQITQLLDEGDLRNVSPAMRRELDAHLASCTECAAEWCAQERIIMTIAPRATAGFIEQCRQLVAAGATRLIGPRRVILYSSLLVLAAAAALLLWRHETPQEVPAAVVVPVAEPVQAPPPQVEIAAQPAPQPARPQPQAPPPDVFTVSVPPLQFQGDDAEGIAMAERFRHRVMELLQAIPRLALVEAPTGPGTVAAEYELRMKYDSASWTGFTRTMGLEIGKSAELAATKAAIAAEATMSPEDRQRSQSTRRLADIQRRNTSMRTGNTGLSLLLGTGTPTLAIFHDRSAPTDRLEDGAHQLVRNLRVNVLPLDDSFEQQELATLRDPSQRQALRRRALGALLIYAERRGGFSRASAEVVRAGGEFALVEHNEVALQRGAVWDALALTESPELIPYLVRGLDEIALTEARLQLVKILSDKYGDDPRAQAALAAAAKSNEQETLRMAALRAAGDSAWFDYVVATLGNAALPELQRLQPIADMAPGDSATLGTSPKTKMVLEEPQLRELGKLVIKVAPDRTANEIARKALFAAGAMETPAALDMLIEVAQALRAENFARGLEGVSVMGLRQTAHQLISFRYGGNPRARAFIEQLARSGDAMDRSMAEMQLRSMGWRTSAEQPSQGQSPVQ